MLDQKKIHQKLAVVCEWKCVSPRERRVKSGKERKDQRENMVHACTKIAYFPIINDAPTHTHTLKQIHISLSRSQRVISLHFAAIIK